MVDATAFADMHAKVGKMAEWMSDFGVNDGPQEKSLKKAIEEQIQGKIDKIEADKRETRAMIQQVKENVKMIAGYQLAIDELQESMKDTNELMKELEKKCDDMMVENKEIKADMQRKSLQVSTKGAAHLKPSEWQGPKSKPWREFADELKNWAMGVDPNLRMLMVMAGKCRMKSSGDEAQRMEDNEECLGDLFNNLGVSGYKNFDEMLYQNLHTLVKGDGKHFVNAHQVDRSGLNFYRELAGWFDPTSAEDQSVEHARLTRPEMWLGKARDPNSARVFLEKWQAERLNYESKYDVSVDEMDLIVALKSIMPDTLFGDQGKFRGQRMDFRDMLKKTTAYLDDKPLNLVSVVNRSRAGDKRHRRDGGDAAGSRE